MHSLLHNLEVSNNNLIPYSACIIMEIYKNEHDQLEIEVSFSIRFVAFQEVNINRSVNSYETTYFSNKM